MNKKTCESKLTLVLNTLSQKQMTSADLKNDPDFYEAFASLVHRFFTGVVTSNSNWILVRTMSEDSVSLANDCTMKFLKKLDYFLALSAERRIKTAVVMANNLIRDQARSHQCRTKHTITPDEYEWSTIPSHDNIESQYVIREQSKEIIDTLLQQFDPLATAAFLGITVLQMKPKALSALFSKDPMANNLIIRQILTDTVEQMELQNIHEIHHALQSNPFTLTEVCDFSAEHLSDLCYETKRKLRKQFR